MAENCPKCNFLNPYGAQICGECGNTLITAESREHPLKTDRINAPSEIKWASIGLEKADKEAEEYMA